MRIRREQRKEVVNNNKENKIAVMMLKRGFLGNVGTVIFYHT